MSTRQTPKMPQQQPPRTAAKRTAAKPSAKQPRTTAKTPASQPRAVTKRIGSEKRRGEPKPQKATPRQPPSDAPTASPRPGRRGSFRIVGIGASAGGLEALELLFRRVPSTSGLAFIVVQHLDPTHKGLLVELLQRATPMKVTQIKDQLRVKPNSVYVIPPDSNLSISQGVLHLIPPVAPRGLRLPIDFFFESLAADQKNRSVAVILSGMGSDGAVGVGAIKKQGGAVFVQAPASAKFGAMPRSAIDAGHADIVAPVEELADRLIAGGDHGTPSTRPAPTPAPNAEGAFDELCALLRGQTGHDFSHYKRSTVQRRIERRMGLHHLDTVPEYVKYLRDCPQETLLLFKELLIGVTSFFRDPEAWDYLSEHALPTLLAERSSGGVLRAWVAGCSTGEEAYSLAIVLREALAKGQPDHSVTLQIFATDLDKDAIDRARQGLYPHSITENVSAERLREFFMKEGSGYRMRQEIRESVIFATQNIIMDPPFTKLDILSCRNLLIYLTPELQKRLMPLFSYSLNPQGLLFLGSAEALGAGAELFDTSASKRRIYRRLDASPSGALVEFPATSRARAPAAQAGVAARAPASNLHSVADRLLLERYSPAAVLTNDQGDILYISGRTGKYLEPAAGKANWNIHAMAREGLRYDLGSAFQKALRAKRTVTQTGVKLEGEGRLQLVDVTIEQLQEPEALHGMVMVVFSDVASHPSAPSQERAKQLPATAARLERELQRAREELRAVREGMQSSQEELKSANEELQSTNEELQSTNEELTTSKEEMQSMNEELQTLNHELQLSVDELSLANNDMRNLLDSTEIATLFLDDALRVRRFTPQMTKIIKLIPGDVGRPLTDLASDLIYPELTADARGVLKSLVFKETPIKTVGGRWFLVRIMPYRTLDSRIDGVVATFADITAAKVLEASLRKHQAGSESKPE